MHTLRAAALAIALWASACVVDAPSVHRADSQPVYASRHFEVDAPVGAGWEVAIETAELPFPQERALFAPWVPPRIGFVRHDWDELWPHGAAREPTILFRAEPAAREGEAARISTGVGRPSPEREIDLAGLRWRVFEVHRTPDVRVVELVSDAPAAKLVYTIRLRVPAQAPDLPPELTRVIAGFRELPTPASDGVLEVERGVGALYDLASEFGWSGAAADPMLLEMARAGTRGLQSLHPDRYEGYLFAAGLAVLAARSTVVYGGEAVGPFDYAYQDDEGRVETTATAGSYDVASVVRDTRAALARQPDSFWARYYLAAALQRGGDLPAAEDELGRLTTAHPESALAWFALALARRDASDRTGALEAAQRATAANERQPAFARFGGGLLLGRTLIDRLVRELRGR